MRSGSEFRDLLELLDGRAEETPDRLGYRYSADLLEPYEELTYAELRAAAAAVSAAIAETGERGDRVLLMFEPGLSFVIALFAAFHAGRVGVPVAPPGRGIGLSGVGVIARDAGTGVILCPASLVPHLVTGDDALPPMRVVTVDHPVGSDGDVAEPAGAAHPLAILQYTSGSTGHPKGVMVSHANLLANVAVIEQKFENEVDGSGVIWLPNHHDMGLVGGVLAPVYTGLPVSLMSPLAMVRRPLRWLQAIDRFRAAISGGPTFAYELCLRRTKPEDIAALDLSCWGVAFVGAEPVRPDVLRAFADHLRPAGFTLDRFYPCYGLAESTLIAAGGARSALPSIVRFDAAALAAGRLEEADDGTAELVGCGTPGAGHAVSIRDADGRPCPDGTVGEIVLTGPSVTAGYWPDGGDDLFIDDADGHWLRTGDLGAVHDGELFVTGRIKEMVIINGQNLYLHDLERCAAASWPGLRGATAAFAIGADAKVVVMHELPKAIERGPVATAMRVAIGVEYGIGVHDVWFVAPGRVLKTTSGKIRRSACRDLYLAEHEPTASEG